MPANFGRHIIYSFSALQTGALDGDGGCEATRVLVVDDNQDAADMLAEGLRLHGLDVRAVYEPLAALQEAAGFRPQVALLDIGRR